MTKLSNRDIEFAFDLICDGGSVRSVAKRLGVSQPSLTERLIKKYGKNYLSQCRPSPTLLLLQEYCQSSNHRISAAAKQFIKSNTATLSTPDNTSFFTLQEEKNRSWAENFIDLDYSILDSRRGRGVCKVC